MPEAWIPLSPWKCHVVPAHYKSRGSGGVDKSNMMPMDRRIHDWQGVIGWRTLVRTLGLKPPREITAYYERRYQAEAA